MASLFSKEPGKPTPPSPYSRDRIEHEIEHLKKGTSVRHLHQARSRGIWFLVIVVGALLWLFFMDPVLHSFRKGDAIRTYLYLHNYGSDAKARALLATGVFTPNEIDELNRRLGNFQDYFASGEAAKSSADSLIHYFSGLTALHNGQVAKLDAVGKVRYYLFIQFGLLPPQSWSMFDPPVEK